MAKEFSRYTEGGRVSQVKVPRQIKFKCLSDELKEPNLVIWDFAKLDNPPQLHALWQALYKFERKVCPAIIITAIPTVK